MKEIKPQKTTCGGLVPTEIRGMYNLPEELQAPPLVLSEGYKNFAASMRARRNPITYLKFQLGLLTPEEV